MRTDVLVCDPHRTFREALAQLLHETGQEVRVTASPREGLEVVRRQPPALCLTELRFPEGQHAGLKLVRAVRETSPATAVLVVSAAATGTLTRAALEAGAQAVLSKNTTLDVLRTTMRRALSDKGISPYVDDRIRRPAGVALTKRQEQVLALLSQGSSTSEVGRVLDVSTHTAREHVQGVLRKLDVHSRLEATLAIDEVARTPDVG